MKTQIRAFVDRDGFWPGTLSKLMTYSLALSTFGASQVSKRWMSLYICCNYDLGEGVIDPTQAHTQAGL